MIKLFIFLGLEVYKKLQELNKLLSCDFILIAIGKFKKKK